MFPGLHLSAGGGGGVCWTVAKRDRAWSPAREELTINAGRTGPASLHQPRSAGRKCGRKQRVVAAAVQSAWPWAATACSGWLRRSIGPANEGPGAATWGLPSCCPRRAGSHL